MVSQLVSVENERIACWVKFNKRRQALVAENKEISINYDKIIQLQHKLLDRLDLQRIPKPLQGLLGKIKTEGSSRSVELHRSSHCSCRE